MATPSPPPDEGNPFAPPVPGISHEKVRLLVPTRDSVPEPSAGPVFGRHFFRLLRENTGGYFLLLFTAIGMGLVFLGAVRLLGRTPGEEEGFLSDTAILLIGAVLVFGPLQMLKSLLAPTPNRQRVGPGREPWTWDHPWRKEWMARDYAGRRSPLLGQLALFALTGLVVLFARSEGNCAAAGIALVFVLASGWVVYGWVKRLVHWLRFRDPVVIWRSIPTFQGETLAGRIAFARPVHATASPLVTLRCVRDTWMEPVGDKASRVLQPYAVYRDTREIPLPGDEPFESIDFAFEVPVDPPGTNLAAEKPTYWQVVVSVPLAGPDLETVFLAPVYARPPRK